MSEPTVDPWREHVDALLERERQRQLRRGDRSLSMSALSELIDASRAEDASPATRAHAAHFIYEHRLEGAETDEHGAPLTSSRDATRARAAQTLARFIAHAPLTLRASLALQADLLNGLGDDPEPTLLALANLWARAPLAARRALLTRASHLDDARLLPAYARCFASLDLPSRYTIVQTCSDLGDLAAEPILRAALLDDRALATLASRALARFGTPASLGDLHSARSLHPTSLLPDLVDATARILERHPVRSSSGALSLVEDDLHGALSALDAPDGQISLYRDVHAAASSGLPDPLDVTALTASADAALSRADQWQALPAAPRPVSPLVPLSLAVLGESPARLLLFAATYPLLLALGGLDGALASLLLPLAAAAALAPVGVGLWQTRRHHAMLRHGETGLALVTDDGDDEILLEYVTPDGALRSRSVRQNALGTLGDERLEPVLYTKDADVALDEMLHVTVERGALTVTPTARALALLTLAAHLAICALITARHAL